MAYLKPLIFLSFLFLCFSKAWGYACNDIYLNTKPGTLAKQDPLPTQRYKKFANIAGGKLWDDSFDESWLQKLVSHNPQVENFLEAIPDSLRRSHTYVINSKSTQFGSAEKPRVILSNSDSTFLLTYSGDPQQRGYNSLEVAIFDRKTSEFTPYEIEIGKDGKLKPPERSPQKCIACHSTNFRPIWNAYPFWPRFYGSFNNPSSSFAASLLKAESKTFKQFLKLERNSGRYQSLIGNKTLTELEDLNSSLTFTLANLNILRVKNSILKMSESNPEIYGLVKLAIRDLADKEKTPRDFKRVLNAQTTQLYLQEIDRLVADTRQRLEKSQLKDITDHMNAFKMDTSSIHLENLWSPEIGMWQIDANMVYHNFRTQEANRNGLETYVLKMANLRFVVEVLGKTPISDWSMSSAQQLESLPFYTTPGDTAWSYLSSQL